MHNDENGYFKKDILTYEFPDTPTYKIDNFSLSIDFIRNTHQDLFNIYKYEQIPFITLESTDECHFDKIHYEYFNKIRNLLSFAIGSAVYPLEIKAKSRKYSMKLKDEKIIYPDINIILASNNPPSDYKKRQSFEVVFSFNEIKDDFENTINRWFEKHETLMPVFNLYFSNVYSKKQFVQSRFLNYIQALETYHRRIYGGKYLEDDDYSELKEFFISAIPEYIKPDFRSSLKSKFDYLHEYSLQKRLKDILKYNKDYTKQLIPINNRFIQNVKNTRNYLTHYDARNKSKAKTGAQLYYLTMQIKYLLDICLLTELGLHDKINNILSKNQDYLFIVSKVKENFL